MRNARSITSENSGSTITTLASAWLRMKAIASASSRVLMALSTAPHIGMPKCASNISGMLVAMIDTVSPLPIPRLARALASRRVRA